MDYQFMDVSVVVEKKRTSHGIKHKNYIFSTKDRAESYHTRRINTDKYNYCLVNKKGVSFDGGKTIHLLPDAEDIDYC